MIVANAVSNECLPWCATWIVIGVIGVNAVIVVIHSVFGNSYQIICR